MVCLWNSRVRKPRYFKKGFQVYNIKKERRKHTNIWLLMQLKLAFTGVPSSWIGKSLHNICVTNDLDMLFPLSWLISWFLKRTIWLLLLLDQELLTCPKNRGLSSVYWEDFEDTKRVIIIRRSKQDRHQHGQKKQDKRTNNDLLNTYTSS